MLKLFRSTGRRLPTLHSGGFLRETKQFVRLDNVLSGDKWRTPFVAASRESLSAAYRFVGVSSSSLSNANFLPSGKENSFDACVGAGIFGGYRKLYDGSTRNQERK